MSEGEGEGASSPRLLRFTVRQTGEKPRTIRCFHPGRLNAAFASDPQAARSLLTRLGRKSLAIQCFACAGHAAWYPVETDWWVEFWPSS